MQNDTTPRAKQFAKLFTYQGAQALAFLQRDSSESSNLVIVVQLWSEQSDHQIRAVIAPEFDDQTQFLFDQLTVETLAEFVDRSPIGGLL